MKNVQISATVQINEANYIIAMLKDRAMVLAQAVVDLEAENAELKRQLEEATKNVDNPSFDV